MKINLKKNKFYSPRKWSICLTDFIRTEVPGKKMKIKFYSKLNRFYLEN